SRSTDRPRTMPAPIATFIPDILEKHVEELAFLWEQRQAAVRDPRYTIRELTHLEERIAAHLQGVLAVGEVALPLLEDTLAGEDPAMVFAAALALLHAKNETATARVRDSFGHAQGPVLAALRAALYAGAWCGQPGVLAVCRKFAAQPTPEDLDALELLAILGAPEDARLVATLTSTPALGPARFHLVGTYGHPALMDLVLAALA